MKLGIIVPLDEQPDGTLRKVRDLGLPTCQVTCWRQELLTESVAARLRAAASGTPVMGCLRNNKSRFQLETASRSQWGR